ncbi:membrane protein [Paenibacillus sp. J23TS9]|uniref:anthrone oxygenase family protein n=1 Tax=Paenibacillus sp. J23TS9 TaxID=2807193 RepID=UPI001B14C264|nr:anthrone oxygenase family protein [Paenibacillus sp. J23TS9]GIP26205.1 membrane protein [Paenibacillus sp. J23TS9]
MMKLLYYVTFVSSLGVGLLAGVFFTFSAFVMQSLTKLPSGEGISAMQSINTTILQSSFMWVFMGSTALSVFLGITSFFNLGNTSALYVIVGSLIFFVGVFLVTAIFNVPLNDTLAAATPGSSEGAQAWKKFLDSWVPWNHVRTIASIGALISYITAIRKW